jgi:hypothetical protein
MPQTWQTPDWLGPLHSEERAGLSDWDSIVIIETVPHAFALLELSAPAGIFASIRRDATTRSRTCLCGCSRQWPGSSGGRAQP